MGEFIMYLCLMTSQSTLLLALTGDSLGLFSKTLQGCLIIISMVLTFITPLYSLFHVRCLWERGSVATELSAVGKSISTERVQQFSSKSRMLIYPLCWRILNNKHKKLPFAILWIINLLILIANCTLHSVAAGELLYWRSNI